MAQDEAKMLSKWVELILNYGYALKMPPSTQKVTQNGTQIDPKWTQMNPKSSPSEAKIVFRGFQGPIYPHIPKKVITNNAKSKENENKNPSKSMKIEEIDCISICK